MARTKHFVRSLAAIALFFICYLMLQSRNANVERTEQLRRTDANTDSFGAIYLNISSGHHHDNTFRDGSGALIKRDFSEEDWDYLNCKGQAVLRYCDEPSYQDAKTWSDAHSPSWSQKLSTPWENPDYQATYGWTTLGEQSLVRNLHINRLRPMLQHYKLSTDASEWVMRTVRHSHPWKDNEGTEHIPSHGYFSYLINKRTSRSTMIWTAMFSPGYMIVHNLYETIEPPLKFASDLYYLQYYRYWAVDRSYPNAVATGGSEIPAPRTIVIRSIHESTIVSYFREIKRLQGDNSPRTGGRKWPGDKFTRDDEDFYVLMASPMGQGVTWFLTQHKHIFRAKSIGRIRVWSTDDNQDDFNMLFEIIDSPPIDTDSSGEELAGGDPPAPERRDLAVRPTSAVAKIEHADAKQTSASRLDRRHLLVRRARLRRSYRRRSVTAVKDEEWQSWQCVGQAMYDLMTAHDDDDTAAVADNNPTLIKWRGKTDTPYHNPRDLDKYGWRIRRVPVTDLDVINVDAMIAQSHLPIDDFSDWEEFATKHSRPWEADGSLPAGPNARKPSQGDFQAYYLRDEHDPAIVVSLTISPQHTSQAFKDASVVPPLQKMSDVIFLTYYEFWRTIMKHPDTSPDGLSTIPPPRFIFIKDVQEEEARDIVFPEIGRRGKHEFTPDWDDDDEHETAYFGNWPGVTYGPDQEEFYVLLSTRQGRGISALLFNHKKELGARRIKSIRIWHSGEELSYFLRFEMEDSPPAPQPLARREPSELHDVVVETAEAPLMQRHDSFDLGVSKVNSQDTKPTNNPLTVQPLTRSQSSRPRGRRWLGRRSVLVEPVIPPTIPQLYDWYCTGGLMHELLISKNADVMADVVRRRRLKKWEGRVSSQWTEYEELASKFGGWFEEQFDGDDPRDAKRIRGLVDAYQLIFRGYSIPSSDVRKWRQSSATPEEEYETSAGVMEDPQEGANYETLFNDDIQNPVMIVEGQWSPQQQDKLYLDRVREPPALSRWSDVVFLCYLNFWAYKQPQLYYEYLDGTKKLPCPKIIIIDDVQNEEALKMFRLMQSAYKFADAPPFPGRVIGSKSELFKVMMGLPAARGVALFLFQHKHVFGVKAVTAIRWTQKKPGSSKHVLIFEIVDVKTPDADGDTEMTDDGPVIETLPNSPAGLEGTDMGLDVLIGEVSEANTPVQPPRYG